MIESSRNSLSVLEAIHDTDEGGVTVVAEETGLAKSTVHDHVETLIELGYVVRTDEGLRLSYRFLGFGLDLRRRTRASAEAAAKVTQLANRTGERAHYIVEEGGDAVFLFSETGENAVETDVSPGYREPLYATASGTAILAHLPEDRIDAIVAAIDFESVDRESVADEAALRQELDRVRSADVAYNEGEYIRNLWSVAAPVFDGDGRLLGSMSVSAPVHRLQHEGVRDDLRATLLETVNELELDIAYA
ncbi:IclR family transcriptional regulator [Halorientalis litorea]|uniref:IclR family transcriptional regulator n=1 Tax=Halorientalis litorea TaxID=2931977 RepID=UPI001FF3779B|nr:IclR family transcriptional regulator [Halorientalis litorea]